MSCHFCPHAKIAPSSMYMPRDTLDHSFVLWRSAEVYRTDRTSKIGNPWGVPTVNSNGSDILPLNRSLTMWSLRKTSLFVLVRCDFMDVGCYPLKVNN